MNFKIKKSFLKIGKILEVKLQLNQKKINIKQLLSLFVFLKAG